MSVESLEYLLPISRILAEDNFRGTSLVAESALRVRGVRVRFSGSPEGPLFLLDRRKSLSVTRKVVVAVFSATIDFCSSTIDF